MTATPALAPARGALPTVRRLVLYVLLFTLVMLTAVGASRLLGLVLEPAAPGETGRTTDLASSLAFVVVAGPLTVVLWRALSKRLANPVEAAAPAWGLYLTAMYTTSMILASNGLFGLLGILASGRTLGWQRNLSAAVIWAAVWWWHQRIRADSIRTPRSLPHLPGILGSWYGLTLGATAAVSALALVFSAAIGSFFPGTSIGAAWWHDALMQVPWIAGGLGLWWWHWDRQRTGLVHGGFADVALVLVGILGAGAAALGETGYLLYTVGKALMHGATPRVLEPVPLSLAAALVGAVVFTVSWQLLAARAPGTVTAGRQVASGLGLAAGASGLGVCVNALFAALTPPLAGDRGTDLLMAGIIWLVLGAGLWVWAWRPGQPADPAGRRVYLVTVFGISAVVALVALIFTGYRLIEFILEPGRVASGLLDSLRAPLGLLVATALVSIYHYVLWRSDRDLIVSPGMRPAGLHTVYLLAGGDGEELRGEIARLTGAQVKLLNGTGEGYRPSVEELAVALAPLSGTAPRILLLVEGPGAVRAIELR